MAVIKVHLFGGFTIGNFICGAFLITILVVVYWAFFITMLVVVYQAFGILCSNGKIVINHMCEMLLLGNRVFQISTSKMLHVEYLWNHLKTTFRACLCHVMEEETKVSLPRKRLFDGERSDLCFFLSCIEKISQKIGFFYSKCLPRLIKKDQVEYKEALSFRFSRKKEPYKHALREFIKPTNKNF